MIGKNSFEIPFPLSITSKVKIDSVLFIKFSYMLKIILPNAGVNLFAFPNMLINIWAKRIRMDLSAPKIVYINS